LTLLLNLTFPAEKISFDIDIEGSNLYIICYWKNKNEFVDILKQYFRAMNNLTLREAIVKR